MTHTLKSTVYFRLCLDFNENKMTGMKIVTFRTTLNSPNFTNQLKQDVRKHFIHVACCEVIMVNLAWTEESHLLYGMICFFTVWHLGLWVIFVLFVFVVLIFCITLHPNTSTKASSHKKKNSVIIH